MRNITPDHSFGFWTIAARELWGVSLRQHESLLQNVGVDKVILGRKLGFAVDWIMSGSGSKVGYLNDYLEERRLV